MKDQLWPRKILHVDMDCFYAAVEMRDDPRLAKLPLVIGSPPPRRSVVSTCNYIARRFGIHSGMSSAEALRRCPSLVFARPEFSKYVEVSKTIRSIFKEYTPLVEPLSLDEAYLDVTELKDDPVLIAREIKRKIGVRTGLVASVGVAPNKFLAKIASDWDKPDGLHVISTTRVGEFLENLELSKIPGVGPATTRELASMGLHTCSDVLKCNKMELFRNFGKCAGMLVDFSSGIDDRPVEPDNERTSMGMEETFDYDIERKEDLMSILKFFSSNLSNRMKREGFRGRRISIKVRDESFRTLSRSKTVYCLTDDDSLIYNVASDLLDKVELDDRGVRLLGLTVGMVSAQDQEQLSFSFMQAS